MVIALSEVKGFELQAEGKSEELKIPRFDWAFYSVRLLMLFWGNPNPTLESTWRQGEIPNCEPRLVAHGGLWLRVLLLRRSY